MTDLTYNGKSVGTDAAAGLQDKLESKAARIGVIGLGYVGLPLAVEYGRQAFKTTGFDVNGDRVRELNRGQNYIDDLDDEVLASLVTNEQFTATASFDAAGEIDVFYICVPTPVTSNKDPDTSYIESAARSIADYLRPGQLIVLKSTTHPNTTQDILQPILEAVALEKGLTLGEDYFLAYSPERIDPGNTKYTTANTPVVVGGVSDLCTELASQAMKQVVEHVHEVSSPRVAEMEKLLENIFRSVNIALVNEMAKLCDRMGDVSIWEVIEAAATKPFGFMPFYPGPGLGGHCIPIDPYYLSWLARQYDFETSFITLSARVNEDMPYYVEDAVIRAIAQQPVRLSDAKVLILGVAFKPDVNDTRRSPAKTIVQLLRDRGIENIDYSDPHVARWELPVNGTTYAYESIDVSQEMLEAYDLGVIVTNHAAFDYELIADNLSAIVDCRNALGGIEHANENVFVLGGGEF